MKRCLELAEKGLSDVAPNPMVGCVIVHNNTIIGEGYHQKYGEAHAEVNAINAVANKSLLQESTLYVNLEPCAHYGKTPPCANLIVEHRIPKVMIGCIDSYSEVSGKGIEKLKGAGIAVTVGVEEEASLILNKRFFTFHNKKRPYIILKWAQTKDGFIDIDRTDNDKSDNWITSSQSKKLVHQWRSQESGILIGTNTALNDNPQLTVRETDGVNPLRIILDLNLRLPHALNIFDNSTPTIIINYNKSAIDSNTEWIQVDQSSNLIDQILEILYNKNIMSVIVEGGNQLLSSFIEANCWDEARVFVGDKFFNKGLKAPIFNHQSKFVETIATDTLSFYTND